MVLQRRRPSGFIESCQPSKVAWPPSGPLWVHEIKHDGYRLMVRRVDLDQAVSGRSEELCVGGAHQRFFAYQGLL
jgi:ATP-dependent DNA ligase